MTPEQISRVGAELEEFLGYITHQMGRSERREALANYMRGLLLDGERKSMVPIAQRLAAAPGDSEAIRQRLQQAITIADWDEWELFRRLALRVEDKLPGLDAFVIDDTGFPKKGKHSVGVQRQYSGTMGRVDNCQVAASLHLASEAGGACIGMRLFLPEVWANDPRRRTKAGVPEELSHQTKLELGLGMLDRALEGGSRLDRCSPTRPTATRRNSARDSKNAGSTTYCASRQRGRMAARDVPEPSSVQSSRHQGRPRTKWSPRRSRARLGRRAGEELACQALPSRRMAPRDARASAAALRGATHPNRAPASVRAPTG
ncbi:transposase [Pseudenhygromyxa sp. WMMC2535]|uniref:IS701 family transposase n=1 Tax=Pseudenhygromyxa sp. WMMC2535 TaxID=2712867 RepID=UPI0031F929E9